MADLRSIKRHITIVRSKSKSPRYPEKLQEKILKLLKTGKYTPGTLADELCINSNVIYKWLKNAKSEQKGLRQVKVERPQADYNQVGSQITVEKANGMKIHMKAPSKDFLISLLREI